MLLKRPLTHKEVSFVLSVVGSQFMQAAITVLVGVVVYVVGQFVVGAVVQPLAEQRRIFADVAAALTMYANLYTNFAVAAGAKPEQVDQATWDQIVKDETARNAEASKTLRELSSHMQGHNLSIPWYGPMAWLRLAPSRDRVLQAGAALIGISNMTPARDHNAIMQNMRWRGEVMQKLGLLKLRTDAPKPG